jgi:hypothetical protein
VGVVALQANPADRKEHKLRGAVPYQFHCNGDIVTLAWSPKGTRVALACDDGLLLVLRLEGASQAPASGRSQPLKSIIDVLKKALSGIP